MASTNQISSENQVSARPGLLVATSITAGFVAAVAMWTGAFVVHLPGVASPTAMTAGLLLLTQLVACAWVAKAAGRRLAVPTGLIGGVIAAAVNSLLLAAVLGEGADQTDIAGGVNLRDDWLLMLGGFFGVSAVVGLIGGAIGRGLAKADYPEPTPHLWLGRFAIVTAVSVFPLLLVGGLVTSSDSGMAVPDWPTTYGENMFLFPYAYMASDSRIFLEHTHRLFGTFVGITTIVLTVWVLIADSRRWAKLAAIGLLALVIVQGLLGGVRVKENLEILGAAHGVLGQIFFMLVVAQAAWLSPLWRSIDRDALEFSKKLKVFSTGFVHAAIFQLITGATYRQLKGVEGSEMISHSALGLHVLFSFVVVAFAFMAAAAAMSAPNETDPRKRTLNISGKALMGVIVLQFALGWVVLAVVLSGGPRGRAPTAEELAATPTVGVAETLLATAHQANGAIALALGAFIYAWVKLARKG